MEKAKKIVPCHDFIKKNELKNMEDKLKESMANEKKAISEVEILKKEIDQICTDHKKEKKDLDDIYYELKEQFEMCKESRRYLLQELEKVRSEKEELNKDICRHDDNIYNLILEIEELKRKNL